MQRGIGSRNGSLKKPPIISRLEREGIGVMRRLRAIRHLWPRTFRAAAHELLHCIASRLPHACAKRNLFAATHTCQILLEDFVPLLVATDCAVARIPPRDLWLHTRLARVERGIEIVQVPVSHIDMRKEIARASAMCAMHDDPNLEHKSLRPCHRKLQ